MKKWSQNEDKLLIKYYPSSTREELLRLFPSRTYSSIQRRADRLNLKKNNKFWNKHYSSFTNQRGDELRKSLKKYEGKDKIVGRPIRLNIQKLKCKPGKDYAEVVFFGDVHYGARECDFDKARAMLDYCYDKEIYVFLMGDLMEAGTRDSPGASLYRQELNPQEQIETMLELLRPLAEKKLILGMLDGNHELRWERLTGILPTKIIANSLKIPYLGYACWNLWYVNNQKYKVYTLHGSSAARFTYTKLKAITDISHSFHADLICMGHVHEGDFAAQLIQDVNKRSRTVYERKKWLVLTGGYLSYDKSYAQERGYPVAKLGSPKVKFMKNERNLYISF